MSTFVIGDVHGRRAQMRRLVEMLPLRFGADSLVLLGDLVDRGDDIPGAVSDAIDLRAAGAIVLRGNHEQMLLDFVDEGHPLWLHPAVGGDCTFEQYTGQELTEELRLDLDASRELVEAALPAHHVEFFRSLPFFHEDEYAFYVHAGLSRDKHPSETDTRVLMWSRDPDFYKHYHGKPCVFGHTPTPLLPLLGRIGRHGIYISHSAIGIDTGYSWDSPLSCLQLPEFVLYQTFEDGRSTTRRFNSFVPEHLRSFRPGAGPH